MMTGRRAQIYSRENDTGWWRDDYSAMQRFNPAMINQLSSALDDLADNPEKRLKLASRALEDVRSRHALEPWVHAVSQIFLNI